MSSRALAYPAIDADIAVLRRYFAETEQFPELRNPHIEPRVGDAVRARAKPAAVLIAILDYPREPRVLVTRRHRNIRFAGHICFPGGRADAGDRDSIDTALRESREEVGLSPECVEVLGCLGDYYTQSGYRISPVVGVVTPPVSLEPNPDEVEEIFEISLARALRSDSYRLDFRRPDRGHFSFHEGPVRIAGPTVSLMINLYETLLRFRGLLERP